MKQDPTFSKYAEAPDLQAYENKPVQNFGLSLLQSMGFTPQRGIGHNKKNALNQPLVLKPRPRGLGLGAQQENEEKKQKFEVGAQIIITKGSHEGLMGIVLALLQQDLRIQLTKSGSTVKVPITDVREISKQEKAQLKGKEKKEEGQRKKKRLKWVVPGIRVKVVDNDSPFYLKKVVVSQVLSQKDFECIFNEKGQQIFLKNLRQKDLQTVIPKPGGEVLILRGSHNGQKAKVLKNEKGKAVVQTHSELQIITVAEDDLSQYVEI